MKYIIYLELGKAKVYFHQRQSENTWKETIYTGKDHDLVIEGLRISLQDVYFGIPIE